jgi:hypothetical protein
MVLAAVSVKNRFRDTSAYSIIKSSLPFFRSVAIRDVDALVPNAPPEKRLGFPGTLELDHWTGDVLDRIGFQKQDEIYNFTISSIPVEAEKKNDEKWDSNPNLEGAKNLIWDSGKSTGLTNSIVWTYLDFAKAQGTLMTVTENDSVKIVTSIQPLGDTSIINLLVSDEDITIASKQIAQSIKEIKVSKVILPFVGKGQCDLIERLSEELGGSLKRRSLTLFRKHL